MPLSLHLQSLIMSRRVPRRRSPTSLSVEQGSGSLTPLHRKPLARLPRYIHEYALACPKTRARARSSGRLVVYRNQNSVLQSRHDSPAARSISYDPHQSGNDALYTVARHAPRADYMGLAPWILRANWSASCCSDVPAAVAERGLERELYGRLWA